jgi:Domain of unknown function (DUF4157)
VLQNAALLINGLYTNLIFITIKKQSYVLSIKLVWNIYDRILQKTGIYTSTLHAPCFNQKSRSLFFTPPVQPKLTINQPNDFFEQEADAAADKVMGMPAGENHFFNPVNISQRKCALCEDEEKVQMKNNGGISSGIQAPPIVNEVISSGGQPLDTATRKFFEPRLNYDFSNVKVHTDSAASKSAQSINALAYTSGNNIVFNKGEYSPQTDNGKRLLGHELTHVVQQKENFVQRDTIQRIKVSSAGSPVDGPCGKFERSFTFTLDNPAAADGYLIQQIDRYDNEVNCPSTGACPAKPTATFWEAFLVRKGKTTFYRQGIGFTDRSGHGSRPNKSGARYAFGEIRFFPIAVTGDLGKNKVAGLWKPGNAGGVTFSGNLPSVDKQPAWWANYTEGPAKRYIMADWRCCNDGNNYNIIKSSV